MSKMMTTSFSENLRRAEKLGLVRTPKPATQKTAKSASTPKPATPAQQGEQLGRQAAECYEKAVQIAGAAPGSAPSKQASRIVNRMIAGVVTRRMKG